MPVASASVRRSTDCKRRFPIWRASRSASWLPPTSNCTSSRGRCWVSADHIIGVVTGIQGKKTFQVVIGGAEGHAGTLPQHERRDALAAFARMAAALHAEIGAIDAEIKFTVGRVTVEPNAPSVVPSRVTFSIDLRHPDNVVLDAAGARVAALCHRHAPPCTVTIAPLVDAPSNDFDPGLRARIGRAAHDQGLPSMAILSAAG